MARPQQVQAEGFYTDLPMRMDRLPWSRWHWLVVFGLGITWILDGLEVTLLGAVGPILQSAQTLHLTRAEIGLSATCYLLGSVLGALYFGYLTDQFGRKRLFLITLAVYLSATALTAFSWNFWSFVLFRFITGTGIGGEYAAINSAIDELIPARVRGRTDLIINSSYWIGTAIGSTASLFFLDPQLLPINLGWRLGFGIGAALGLVILVVRRFIPESPRWLMTHGRMEEAERIVSGVEVEVMRATGRTQLDPPEGRIYLRPHRRIGFGTIIQTILRQYLRRSILGLALMVAQAFFYNGIFFTYAFVLTGYYGISPDAIGLYLLPFALGNFLGPLVLGHWFDTIGRKPMIAATYAISAVMLALTGYLFAQDLLSARTQTIAWMLIFFVASSAASSAYLTVSEIFPIETRAMAISLFFALGTGIGGVGAPALFGRLLEFGSRQYLFYGYLLGALLMLAAAGVELAIGVKAERQSLEAIAAPLSSQPTDRT